MKKFYTYEEQIEHLKKKGLVIADEEAAISALKRYSYYAGVSAYKDIFKIGPNDNYIPGKPGNPPKPPFLPMRFIFFCAPGPENCLAS